MILLALGLHLDLLLMLMSLMLHSLADGHFALLSTVLSLSEKVLGVFLLDLAHKLRQDFLFFDVLVQVVVVWLAAHIGLNVGLVLHFQLLDLALESLMHGSEHDLVDAMLQTVIDMMAELDEHLISALL